MSPAPSPTGRSWKRLVIFFLGGQAVSLFGSALVQYALIWYVTMGTQSGGMITVATLVGFVPMMLVTPFGGVWADRMNRRFIIAAADGLVALSTLALLVAFLAGYGSYMLVFAAMAARALGGGIQGPAVGALLPQIVPAQHLGRVNGYNTSIQAGVNLVAPMAAGGIYAFATIEWILAIDIITAIIGIGILLLLVKVPAHERAQASAEQSGFQDLKDGVRYIHRNELLRRLIFYFAAMNFMITPLALLTPLQVTRVFANDPIYLSIMEASFAVGMLVGGIVIGSWGGFKSRITTIAISMIATGAIGIAIGIPITFWLYCTWMFLCGVLLPGVNTPAITILQLSTEEQYMGRIFSVVNMIGIAAMPLAMLIFGPLADRISIETIIIATGIAIMLLGIVLLRDRRARELEPSAADLLD
ncbi:MAG: MFS transporter [Ancrocorticia sp.]